MSQKGNCLDNSVAENFFSILKSELYYAKEKQYKNISELEKDIIGYIDYYNNIRIKLKLKGMSLKCTPKNGHRKVSRQKNGQ